MDHEKTHAADLEHVIEILHAERFLQVFVRLLLHVVVADRVFHRKLARLEDFDDFRQFLLDAAIDDVAQIADEIKLLLFVETLQRGFCYVLSFTVVAADLRIMVRILRIRQQAEPRQRLLRMGSQRHQTQTNHQQTIFH